MDVAVEVEVGRAEMGERRERKIVRRVVMVIVLSCFCKVWEGWKNV